MCSTSGEIVQSTNDRNEYRAITLDNKLRVLLIYDASESLKSAAGLRVKVGTFSDLEDVLGLAHLHEHMLFMEALATQT